MSTELKLPSYIYEEKHHQPVCNKATNNIGDISNSLKMDMLSEYLNNYLIDLNTKITTCLTNQSDIISTLVKIEKKLEEFE